MKGFSLHRWTTIDRCPATKNFNKFYGNRCDVADEILNIKSQSGWSISADFEGDLSLLQIGATTPNRSRRRFRRKFESFRRKFRRWNEWTRWSCWQRAKRIFQRAERARLNFKHFAVPRWEKSHGKTKSVISDRLKFKMKKKKKKFFPFISNQQERKVETWSKMIDWNNWLFEKHLMDVIGEA